MNTLLTFYESRFTSRYAKQLLLIGQITADNAPSSTSSNCTPSPEFKRILTPLICLLDQLQARPMDRMWSPWRSAYVSEANERELSDDASVFTQLLKEEQDEETLILWRGEQVFVIMNRHPYNSGHLLIVPYREVVQYDALTTTEQEAIAAAIDRCMGWIRDALSPDGFNVGMNLGRTAGAGIPEHLHVHVLPRWDGDTNFMPTTADTKVLPEDLHTTYDKLRATMEPSARDSTKNAGDKIE